MTCITMNTGNLLCNFFGSQYYYMLPDHENGVSVDTINNCAKVLSNNLPTYLFYDASLKGIIRSIEYDEELLDLKNKFNVDMEKRKIYYNGGKIDLKKCNSYYQRHIADKIENIVNRFFINNMYKMEIKIMFPIYG